MKESIQAHQGHITFLEGSQCHPDATDSIGSRDHLVSCGTDYVLRIWQVRHRQQGKIELEAKSLVKLLKFPCDISMAGNTICMAMKDNTVIMCRFVRLTT